MYGVVNASTLLLLIINRLIKIVGVVDYVFFKCETLLNVVKTRKSTS